MAERWAVASGNASSTATWNGGTLPTVFDDVYANGYTVTLNQSVSWLSVRNTAGTTAAAGGSFSITNGIAVTATVISGSTSCLTWAPSSGHTCSVNGNLFGGSAANARGLDVTTANASVCTVTGNIYSGTAAGAYGVSSAAGSLVVYGAVYGALTGTGTSAGVLVTTGTGTIHGNVVAGAGSGQYGVYVTSSGTLTVNGNAIGGANTNAAGVVSVNSANVTVNGCAKSADVGIGPGIYSVQSAACITVREAVSGAGGAMPFRGRCVFLNEPLAVVVVPAPSDLRHFIRPVTNPFRAPMTAGAVQ